MTTPASSHRHTSRVGTSPASVKGAGDFSHMVDREVWSAEAERLHFIGDRKGRKHALERLRAATMAVLAAEVRNAGS